MGGRTDADTIRPVLERQQRREGQYGESFAGEAIGALDRLAARLVAVEDALRETREKLISAYRYRETQEGLPPGTLTSKVAAADTDQGPS